MVNNELVYFGEHTFYTRGKITLGQPIIFLTIKLALNTNYMVTNCCFWIFHMVNIKRNTYF